MWERGCFTTTILAQPRRLCRPRHPYAVPRTSLPCVCTRRRNCIEQLSPSQELCALDRRFSSPEVCHNQTDPLPKGELWVNLRTDPKINRLVNRTRAEPKPASKLAAWRRFSSSFTNSGRYL